MRHRLVILDLDGTLFRGDQALPGAVEAVAEIRRRGVGTRFLTNNSSQTREALARKLQGLGFEAAPEEVYSSAIGTAAYLAGQGLRNAFVLGDPGLVQTLQEAGIEIIPEEEDSGPGRPAAAVVVGICRSLSYRNLAAAMQHLLAGARFVATNADATYPLEEGRLVPGAGAMVAAVQACSGREPFVVGKPNPLLIELILREAGVAPQEALVVGDRFETDIVSGRRAGCDVRLVLTGVAREAPEGVPWSRDLAELVREG